MLYWDNEIIILKEQFDHLTCHSLLQFIYEMSERIKVLS